MSMHSSTDTPTQIDALTAVAHAEAQTAKTPPSGKAFQRILLVVFFIALLLALVAGVSVYQSVSAVQTQNNAEREGVGLICNVVRANDAIGSIAAGKGPEGKSLVVVERLDSGTYETRFYLYEGKIVQEYSLASNQYTPEKASEVTESSTFDFAYANGLLSIYTDGGTSEVALRNMQGGE